MQLRTKWLLFVWALLLVALVAAPALAAEKPAAEEISTGSDVLMGIPLVVGGTEGVKLTADEDKLLQLIKLFAGNTNPGNGGNDTSPGTGSGTRPSSGMTADERTMFDLVNRERTEAGLSPLKFDASLLKLARVKAQDMLDSNYFSHPSPSDGLRSAGIQYVYAGENLAMAPTVNSAHERLMNSAGHATNILNENYDRLGIGVAAKGSNKYFVQMFIGGQHSGDAKPAMQPKPEPQPEPQPSSGQGTNNLTADEEKMFQLVNQERTRSGVGALKINPDLVKLARLKGKDMIEKGYFNHGSPTYGSPFDMMKQFGVKYSNAGENLAGAPSVSMAHQNLMNSDGHRRNILSSNFTEIGIGVIDGGPYGKIFVQMFIRP